MSVGSLCETGADEEHSYFVVIEVADLHCATGIRAYALSASTWRDQPKEVPRGRRPICAAGSRCHLSHLWAARPDRGLEAVGEREREGGAVLAGAAQAHVDVTIAHSDELDLPRRAT